MPLLSEKPSDPDLHMGNMWRAQHEVKGKATKIGSKRDASRRRGQKGKDMGVRVTQATKRAGRMKKERKTISERKKRSAITNRLFSTREIQRLGTWNMPTLWGLGKNN